MYRIKRKAHRHRIAMYDKTTAAQHRIFTTAVRCTLSLFFAGEKALSHSILAYIQFHVCVLYTYTEERS